MILHMEAVAGMVIQPDVIYNAFKSIKSKDAKVIYMTPQGKKLDQKKVEDLSKEKHLIILCGHYEGIDQRVIDKIVDEEISIGDYVLTGGELPALVLADAVSRLVPGVLSDELCFSEESHYSGLLEYPQYTKPSVWRGREVPEVLLSGHHANIEAWRRERSLEETFQKRPDLLAGAELSEKDKKFLSSMVQNAENNNDAKK